jgi:hypothetical protein
VVLVVDAFATLATAALVGVLNAFVWPVAALGHSAYSSSDSPGASTRTSTSGATSAT